MTGRIFLNYRRSDDPGFTHALHQRLLQEFPRENLYMDVEGSIAPGDDFVEVISNLIAASDIVLVIIGPRWLELMKARATGGGPDFVVIEIESALEAGKRLIPVLVGGALMPDASDLPAAIERLARRNAVAIRAERFGADSRGLCDALKSLLSGTALTREEPPQAARAAADLVVRPASIPARPGFHQLTISSQLFRTALGKTLFAMSSDTARLYLNGLYLHPAKQPDGQATLRMVSTDGHRLALVELADQAGLGNMPGIILPREAAYQTYALLDGAAAELAVVVAPTEVSFSLRGRSFTYQPIDGTFPTYASVFPHGSHTVARLDRRTLLGALESILTSPEDAVRIRLHFSAQALDIEAEGVSPSRISVQIGVQYVHRAADLSVHFNRWYLHDILSRLEADFIDLKFDGPETPASFHETTSNFCTYVLMPMRG